jgi:ATPase subunit of ABC transporter with duplicated ATPase domains
MPSVEVDVKISATGGTSLVEAGRITVSDSATVFNPTRAVTDSALEAAKEATEAAQAATDAAILAQKSADAATLAADLAAKTSAEAAAQAKAALDAVNALSLQVTKMIANFAKMQKTIAAIAKKVKA